MKDQKKKDMVKSEQVENERKRLKSDMNSPRGGFGGKNRGGFNNRGNYGSNNNNHNKSGPYTFGQPNVYSNNNNRDSYNSNDNKRRRY